ncbi:MAG: hypothetical protein ACI8TX_000200 [Hyphomicrobiaceae bacterium]|jgi:hypothetical protein
MFKRFFAFGILSASFIAASILLMTSPAAAGHGDSQYGFSARFDSRAGHVLAGLFGHRPSVHRSRHSYAAGRGSGYPSQRYPSQHRYGSGHGSHYQSPRPSSQCGRR